MFFHCNNGCTNTPQCYVYTYIACLVFAEMGFVYCMVKTESLKIIQLNLSLKEVIKKEKLRRVYTLYYKSEFRTVLSWICIVINWEKEQISCSWFCAQWSTQTCQAVELLTCTCSVCLVPRRPTTASWYPPYHELAVHPVLPHRMPVETDRVWMQGEAR